MPQITFLKSSLFARAASALVASVLSAAVGAAGQTPAPAGAGAVRERRAASKAAPAAKAGEPVKGAGAPALPAEVNNEEAGEKGAAAGAGNQKAVAVEETKGAVEETKGAPAGAEEAESAAGEPEALGASGEPAAASGELTVEELRARVESERNKVTRARLQRELVERLSAEGRTAEAVASLRAMLAEERFDPPFFYNVGNHLARLGESGAAVEAYRKAAGQRRGGYARAQHNLGVVLTRLGRWEEAEAALTTALRLENFTYADASYNLGRLHALRGESGLAIEEWSRTLRIRPDHAPAAAALALALAADGDPEEAVSVLDSFAAGAARRGRGVPGEVAAARAEIMAGLPAEAGGREEKNVEKSEPRRRAAESLTKAGGYAAGRPLAVGRRAYDFLRRARAAREGARFDEAVALYREAIESNGGYFAPADLELGFALAGLRRTDEAAAQFRAVTRRSGPRYPIAFYHLGRLLEHAGRFAEAGDAYARAAELMGDAGPQFYVDLSRAREKEGKPAEALAAMESYLRAAARLGDVPDWARERLAKLRRAQPAAARN